MTRGGRAGQNELDFLRNIPPRLIVLWGGGVDYVGLSYLVNSSERHDEDSDEEIRQGETQDEIISDRLEVSVQEDCHHNKNIS